MYCCEKCGHWVHIHYMIAHSGAIVCEDCFPKEENNENDLQDVWQSLED